MLNIVLKAYINRNLMTQFSRYWKFSKNITGIVVYLTMKAKLVDLSQVLLWCSRCLIFVKISNTLTWTFFGVKTTSLASVPLSFRFPVGESILFACQEINLLNFHVLNLLSKAWNFKKHQYTTWFCQAHFAVQLQICKAMPKKHSKVPLHEEHHKPEHRKISVSIQNPPWFIQIQCMH